MTGGRVGLGWPLAGSAEEPVAGPPVGLGWPGGPQEQAVDADADAAAEPVAEPELTDPQPVRPAADAATVTSVQDVPEAEPLRPAADGPTVTSVQDVPEAESAPQPAPEPEPEPAPVPVPEPEPAPAPSAPADRMRAALRAAEPDPYPVDDTTPIGALAAAAVRATNTGGRHDFPKPPHRRILTVANQKGGVGKTTTTVNLAAALALHGATVLVVDLDPQGNASTGLGVPHHAGVANVYDVLIDQVPLAEVAVPAEGLPRLTCVPATIDLAGAEIELVSVVARESRLKRAIDAHLAGPGADVDYVLIDCPPSLGLLTVNAMVATEEVLIPIQCEYYALEGLGQLLKNVELVRAHLNPALHVSTILLTMYDGRTKLADQVVEEVRNHFGETVLSTLIPRSVRVSEAPGYGQSVVTYDPGSRGSLAYVDAAREIAERGLEPSAQDGGTSR